jgi:ATP-dependent helicase Lhr and Lhr-like helicase
MCDDSQRYGVVFWRLLAREAGWLPPWRELLRIYRRLEARGESAAGALSPVFPVSNMRFQKRSVCCGKRAGLPHSDQWISLPGADPLNLIGIVTPGPRLPALTDNRLIYRDGLPVATLGGRQDRFSYDVRRRQPLGS